MGQHMRSGQERASNQYIGMGDFVVSDDDVLQQEHKKHNKSDDFVISDDVQTSDPPEESISDDYQYETPYSNMMKEELIIKITKRVRLGNLQRPYEVPLSNETYLYYAQ